VILVRRDICERGTNVDIRGVFVAAQLNAKIFGNHLSEAAKLVVLKIQF